MPNFCENCGAPLSQGMKFCENCGTPINFESYAEAPTDAVDNSNVPQGNTYAEEHSHKPNKKFIMLISAIGGGVILFLTLLIVLFSLMSYKKPIKEYYNALNSDDSESYADSFSEYYFEIGDISKRDVMRSFDNRIENNDDKYGDGWRYDYQIINEESVDVLDDDEIEYIEDALDDANIDVKVEKLKVVNVKYSLLDGRGNKEYSSRTYFVLVKSGLSYKILCMI